MFDAYYVNAPEYRVKRLQAIESLIRKISPKARASMRYKMPTFDSDSGWIAFANQKHYISIYTCSSKLLSPYLKKYPDSDCGKGCLRFSDSKEIDFEALSEIIHISLNKTEQGAAANP